MAYMYIEHLDIATVLFGVVSFLSLTWWLRQSKANLPPGPWGWPLLGYLPNFAILKYRTGLPLPHIFNSLAKKYGPVLCVDFAGQKVVILNNFKYAKDGFNHPNMNDRPTLSHMKEAFGGDVPQGLGIASGEPWKQQRRFTLTTLRSFGVGKKSFEENISEEVRSLADEIINLKGKGFDPCHFLNNATSNVICSVVFGKRFDYSDPVFKRMMKLLNEDFKDTSSGGIYLFVPTIAKLQDKSVMLKRKREILNFLKDYVIEHKKDRVVNAPRDYIDVYLDEITQRQTSNPDSAVNEKNLPDTVMNLFAAGTETTATTLRWAILYMATFPEIQDRVHQEMDSVTGRNRFPQLSDKTEVPFTWATILEVQRIASIAPLGVPHMCAEDTALGSHTIPKGAIVFANLWAIHHDPDLWLSPDEFKPDRFLDEDGNVKEKQELIPFAVGRRICLGEHLAKMELYIFFTHLLHQFTIKMPKDSPPVSLEGFFGRSHSPDPFLVEFIPRE